MSVDSIQQLWFWGSSLVMALLLYRPAEKLIWTLRVRGMERRLARVTSEQERAEERRKARLVAGVLVLTFSLLFTRTFIHF